MFQVLALVPYNCQGYTNTSDNQLDYIHHHIDAQVGHVLDGECLLLWYLCVLHQLGQVL